MLYLQTEETKQNSKIKKRNKEDPWMDVQTKNNTLFSNVVNISHE